MQFALTLTNPISKEASMKLWGFDHGASGALRSCFKLASGALTALALAWTAGPAHAVTYTFQNIIDPLNPTFTHRDYLHQH
jgi:hypothetical protein